MFRILNTFIKFSKEGQGIEPHKRLMPANVYCTTCKKGLPIVQAWPFTSRPLYPQKGKENTIWKKCEEREREKKRETKGSNGIRVQCV